MKNVASIIILLVTVAFSLSALAQEGYVRVSQSAEMDSLLIRDKEWRTENPEWEGYRIQVFFDAGNNSKRKAQDVMEGFVMEFEKIPAFLSFREPYYRVRVGNFHTRLQAAEVLSTIARKYPGAFVVKETINPEIPSFQELNPHEEKKSEEEYEN